MSPSTGEMRNSCSFSPARYMVFLSAFLQLSQSSANVLSSSICGQASVAITLLWLSLIGNFLPGKGGKCGPPPVIENGDLLSFPMQEYRQGTTLEYKCPSLYVLEGSRYITCTDGQWTSPPVCLGRLKHVLGGQRPRDCSCCLFLRSQGHDLHSSPCAGAVMPAGQNGSESFFCPEGVSS